MGLRLTYSNVENHDQQALNAATFRRPRPRDTGIAGRDEQRTDQDQQNRRRTTPACSSVTSVTWDPSPGRISSSLIAQELTVKARQRPAKSIKPSDATPSTTNNQKALGTLFVDNLIRIKVLPIPHHHPPTHQQFQAFAFVCVATENNLLQPVWCSYHFQSLSLQVALDADVELDRAVTAGSSRMNQPTEVNCSHRSQTGLMNC
jgi:hypothetical protein